MTIEADGYILHHVGLEVDFHHPLGAKLKPSEAIEDLYGEEKGGAPIFYRRRDGRYFSCDDLLGVFLERAGKPVTDFVVKGLPVSGRKLAGAVFPMEFPSGVLAMDTEQGLVDVARLRIAVELGAAST